MIASAMAGVPAPNSGHSSEQAKIVKAAQDFEAVLLNSLLHSLQQTFTALPGEDSKAVGSGDYSYMSTQALAAELASHGGLGLGSILAGQLRAHEGTG